jgi:lipid A ethanolaminephosphotransferase
MRPLWLVVLASLWIATVCNVALWRELSRLPGLSGGQALTISIALALVIALATTALLSLLAWRWTLKPAITVFLLSAAFGAYFMMVYGVVIDKTMMVNTLQTDVRETRDLLNWRLLATVLVLAVLPLVLAMAAKNQARRRRATGAGQRRHADRRPACCWCWWCSCSSRASPRSCATTRMCAT